MLNDLCDARRCDVEHDPRLYRPRDQDHLAAQHHVDRLQCDSCRRRESVVDRRRRLRVLAVDEEYPVLM